MADTTYGNLAVGEGVRMQGNLSVPGEAIIDGQIQGVLTAQSVFVTDNGAIQGTTTADHVRVAGKVSETTVANKTLLIERSGQLLERFIPEVDRHFYVTHQVLQDVDLLASQQKAWLNWAQ